MKLFMRYSFCVLVLFVSSCWLSNQVSAQGEIYHGADQLQARFEGKTKPLRDLTPKPGTHSEKQKDAKGNKPKFLPPNFIGFRRPEKINSDALPIGEDPVRQSQLNRFAAAVIEPTVVIEGIHEEESNAGVPDTNGEAGADHFIQIVNASYLRIFDKDGTPLTDVISANTIWNEIGRSSFSDPVIQYDEAAQRWLLTDLAAVNIILYGVSETSDPMGSWNLYVQNTPGFADYPKYGIWPNSYILTINEGRGVFPVYALNREQMLNGEATIDVQRVEIPEIFGAFPTVTPMDWNSPLPPPTDEVFAVRMNDDAWGNDNSEDVIEIWKIIFDWDTPTNTRFESVEIPVAAFDSDGCSVFGGGFECIPQPGTSVGVDGIMTIVMNNVAYWNYGTHESAVITFTVDATGQNQSGIRWMEVRRRPGFEWTLYQEGTYAPDDDVHRFIPSISINGKGDIGLAYSVSNGTDVFPSLRYTGRSADDPLGQMSVDEYQFATGLSFRLGERFGDYAKMSVDPEDDSFWFTSEYMLDEGEFGTKIVNFKITQDSFDIAVSSLDEPVSNSNLNQEAVTMTIVNKGLTPATNITLGYQIDGAMSMIENALIDTLFFDSTYSHTFADRVDMSIIRPYEFKIFTHFDRDERLFNDTLITSRAHLPQYDVGVRSIEGISTLECDTFALVDITIANYGTEDLTSVDLIYSANGGMEQVFPWVGTVISGQSHTLSQELAGFRRGDNTCTIRTGNPNGEVDQNMNNDTSSVTFDVVSNPVHVDFTLEVDAFFYEISWTLTDQDDVEIYSGNGGDVPYASTNQTWCLEDGGCYTFTIYDSYGDGLYLGGYSIIDEDGNTLVSSQYLDFGFQEDSPFCINQICDVDATVDVTDAQDDIIYSGAILITVLSGIAPYEYSIDNGQTFQSDNMFTDLDAGTYDVVVRDANNCTWTREVEVDRLVAASDIKNIHSIVVSPNPSEDGLYLLEVIGQNINQTSLQYQVITMSGQHVQYGEIPKNNSSYTGLISLYKYPTGVYYIRFVHNDINEMIKVIRL